MPINIEELNKINEKPQNWNRSREILAFFHKNKDKAYTAKEISEQFELEMSTAKSLLSILKHKTYLAHKKPYWCWNSNKWE